MASSNTEKTRTVQFSRIANALESLVGTDTSNPFEKPAPKLTVALNAKQSSSKATSSEPLATPVPPTIFVETISIAEDASLVFEIQMFSGNQAIVAYREEICAVGSITINLGYALPEGTKFVVDATKGGYSARVSYLL